MGWAGAEKKNACFPLDHHGPANGRTDKKEPESLSLRFLVACTRFYTLLCLSVGRSVGPFLLFYQFYFF